MLKKFLVGAAVILLGGAISGVFVKMAAERDYQKAAAHYVEREHADSLISAGHVAAKFQGIYENLRTISLLPTVRKIDRHATKIDDDAKGAIQEIYNNLANSVAVSEVYIVPASFDPNKIDPVTQQLEKPSLVFDQLIVDAGRLANATEPFAAQSSINQNAPAVPEVETYEYWQLADQIAWLKKRQFDLASFNRMRLPMISGPEVITCDNTEFVKTGKDADRLGLIFSVPFYDLDGVFSGVITAVVRSNTLKGILPGEDFALINPENNFVLPASQTGQAQKSLKSVVASTPDSSLIYSELLPLTSHDPKSKWTLWVGHPNSRFLNNSEVGAVKSFEMTAMSMIALVVMICLIFWALILRKQETNRVLEAREAKRSEEMSHAALHDALTGLPNRVLLRQRMDEAMARVKRGEKMAMLWVDLDHFKNINDSLGHPVGDALLKTVAARMLECVRKTDTVARIGGDEFLILQLNVGTAEQSAILAQRLIDKLSEPIELDGHQVVTGASVGISVAIGDGEDAETILRNADIALYRAKLDGRNTYRFFQPSMEAAVRECRELEMGLRRALMSNEFVLHYQPLIDAESEEILGFEALIRWQDPEKGMVAPGVFIPVAEEIAIIAAIGEWALMRACMDAASWPDNLRVAVNLSPLQFKSVTLGPNIIKALNVSGLKPSRLELEITESVLLAANEPTMDLLHQLRNLGVKIALDDFGTGYSSLSYLQSFPFDKIKIDRSFVSQGDGTEKNSAIVRAIVAMAGSLGMATTAEGVETLDQLERIRGQGCTELQGYLFSRPIPLNEVHQLLEHKKALAA